MRLEFKEAKTAYSLDKLVTYCVALANEGGGKMILGVTDARPRQIVGTAAFAEPGNLEANLHAQLGHRIPAEELQMSEGRVLLVHVPARLPGTAWQVGGRYLKRAGDALVGMDDVELKNIFAETGPDFSAESCPGAVLSDLAPEAIALFRTRWAQKSADPRKAQWTDVETLTNAELLIDGQLTYAALILFGTRSALGRRLAQAEVVFEYRSSEASGPAADREESASISDDGKMRSDRTDEAAPEHREDWPCRSAAWRTILRRACARTDRSLCGSMPSGWRS